MPRHARAKLTLEQARAIYLDKLEFMTSHIPSRTYANCFTPEENALRGKSALVSYRYNVSPKTIRDIWCRKTWIHATNDLVHDSNDPAVNGAHGNEVTLVAEPWPNSTHELAHDNNDPFRDDARPFEDEFTVGFRYENSADAEVESGYDLAFLNSYNGRLRNGNSADAEVVSGHDLAFLNS